MKKVVFLTVLLSLSFVVHASVVDEDIDIIGKKSKVAKEIKELSLVLEELKKEEDPSKKYLEEYYENYISDYQKLESSIRKDTDVDLEISAVRRKNNLFLSAGYM